MQTTDIILSSMDDLVRESIQKKIKKLTMDKLTPLAKKLNVLDKDPTAKRVTKTKKIDLILSILSKMNDLTIDDQIILMRENKTGLEIEVKNILLNNIPVDDLVNTKICLPLLDLFKDHPVIESLFTNTCDLENVKNNIKSSNCKLCIMQGLYILTIRKEKSDIDHIVKLGSFAESQGMFKRICSFGGGNHETGSATNKWFQRFIKKALAEGYTSKFTYYNKVQEKIKIDSLDGEIEMTPYVMRPLETQLFQKYNGSNSNIPPIFGSNCL